MTLPFLSAAYYFNGKNLFKAKLLQLFRSHSQHEVLHNSSHRRTNSSPSADIFSLIVSPNNDSSLSSLICSICSLPMMKPILLPCQHTFCYKCVENRQQVRSGSLPIYSNNCLMVNNNPTRTITCPKCLQVHHINSLSELEQNQSVELLVNSLLCEKCQQLYPPNQIDTCLHCFGSLCLKCYEDHIKSHDNTLTINKSIYRTKSTEDTVNISFKSNEQEDSSVSQIFQPRSINTKKKPTNNLTEKTNEKPTNEHVDIDPSQNNNTKKKSNNLLRKIMKPSRHSRSTSVPTADKKSKSPSPPLKNSASTKTSRRSKPIKTIKIEDVSQTVDTQPASPITPIRRFLNLSDQYTNAGQHIIRCKQRQSELDQVVNKLLQVLTIKMNENIEQISQYWKYIKQISLDRLQPKTNRLQLFNYLVNNCCSIFDTNKSIESYLQQNDDIKAALQVLYTTLVICNNQSSSLIISQLFDHEEQVKIRSFRRLLDSLLSSYNEELLFATERVNICEYRFASWKNSNTSDLDSIIYEWEQIVEHDYPSLIGQISNDFVTKIPQIENTLTEMIKSMKKRLLAV